jgi:ABC-type lipoprotein export system ATPase subunit
MLKRIILENYRSCLRTSIDLHPKLSVLIGPNGSGKTNILRGIMLLNQLVRGPEHFARQSRLTSRSRIRASFHADVWKAYLRAAVYTFANESNNEVVTKSRQLWRLAREKGRDRRFTSNMPLGLEGFRMSHQLSLQRLLRYRRYAADERQGHVPKWAWSVFDEVAKFCYGITYYGASQFTNPGTCPTSFQIEREGKLRSLDRMRGHAKILSAMYSASRSDNTRPFREFIDIVGPKGLRLIDAITFREVRTSSTEYSVRVGGKVERRKREKLLIVPQFRIGRQTLSPNQLSEGTFKTLALLFHVITEDSTALLVEEPEVCVHHGLLASILELIKSYSNRKQMILSTHSDYVLDHVDPENVYRVSLTESTGTTARQIQKTMNSKEIAALRSYLETAGNLGEYWREGGLGDRA